MLRNRGLVVLLAITAVTVIAAGWSLSERYADAGLAQKEGGLVFPDLKDRVGSISSVEISRAAETFVLQRQPEGWANMGAGGFPARQTRIEKMIGGLVALSYFEPKTARAKLYPKIEVEDVTDEAKSTRLTVKDEGGTVLADIIIGKAKTDVAGLDRDGVYIRTPGEERSWLAEGVLDVRYDSADWSDRQMVDVRAGDIGFMGVTHADGHVIELYRKQSDDPDLTVKNLPANAEVEHQYQIDYMAGLLDNVRFEDAMPAKDVDFTKDGGFEAIVVSSDGLVVMMRAAPPNKDGTTWVQVDADVAKEFEPTEDARKEMERIKADLDGWAFLVPRAKTERLKIRLDDIIKISADSDRKEG